MAAIPEPNALMIDFSKVQITD